jgi:hypothetical protein
MTTPTALLIATATVALLSLPVQAQDLDDTQIAEAMDFAMHDAVFTMYHEIGHMLVGELGLPVLGKEEDAADALATIMLLLDDTDEDSYNALIDSADGWYFNAVKSTGEGVDALSYYSDHSLDIQRAYAMVCMMVGKDPEAFAQTADAYELDADRRESCGYTFAQAASAWATLLAPHEVTDAPGAEITVTYEDAGDYEVFAEALKERQVLERAAALISESYVLPGPVTFTATLCGEANAYYSPSESAVTYCYELADSMFALYVNDILPLAESEADAETADSTERAEGDVPRQDLVGRWSDAKPAAN